MIWKKAFTLDELKAMHKNTMPEFIGIEFLEVGDDYIKARMPVNEKTKQALGLLHGGASVVLAETIGSISSAMCIDREKQTCLGLEINANHIRAVNSGYVYGITSPIHLGRSTQVWEIKIYDEENRLTCISRITNAILERKMML